VSGLGSVRTAIGCGAAALALGLAVVLTRPTPAPVDALWPDGNPVVSERIVIEHPGEPALRLARSAAGWHVLEPAPGPTLPGVVPDLLRAIAGARIQRRAATSPAPVAFTVQIDAAPPWQVSAPVPGGGRWWSRAGAAYLVDGWIGDAADLRVATVRRADPLPVDLAQAESLEVRLPGQTLMLIDGARAQLRETGPVVIDASARREVLAALDGLVAASFPVAPAAALAPRPWIIVRAGGAELQLADAGPCVDGGRRLATAIGDICAVVAPQLDAALTQLAGPPQAWMATALAEAVHAVTLLDGTRLSRHGGTWRVGGPALPDVPAADDAAARVVDAIVRARGAGVPTPASAPDGWLEVADADGRRARIAVWRTLAIAGREGEPLALPVDADDQALVAASWHRLRERQLWTEEPLAVTAVELPSTRPLELGAPEAALIAAPRALERGLERPRGAPARRLRIAIAAPPVVDGQPTLLELALWREPGGCVVEAPDRDRPGSTDVARLAPATCAALLTPVR
jgi:hypothetical protein